MRKRPDPNEITTTYYGIDAKTFQVVGVSQTRGGLLSRWIGDRLVTHPVIKGRVARTEVVVAFGLTDIIEIHGSVPPDIEEERLKRLREKAEQLKATSASDD